MNFIVYFHFQREKYKPGIVGEYTIMEMMEVVAKIVDESDPDTSLPNNIHMYQVRRKLSIGGRANSKVK